MENTLNLLGYIMYRDGSHEAPVEIHSYKELARFINDDFVNDKIVTDVFDITVVTTFGNFLDRIDTDKVDRALLMKELLPLQLGGAE